MSGNHRFSLSRKTIVISSVVIVIIAGIVIGVLINQRNAANNNANETVQNPEYSTLLPNGTSIEELGGWNRVSPEDSDPVYAYADTIDGVQITVSEQPLPASFKNNIDSQVAELAKKFSATDQIETNGTKIYIGTSAKGPQSVIFARGGLLILVKSQKKIDDSSWKKYADSLTELMPKF